MNDTTLLALTVDLVSAHVSRNQVSAEQLPKLIASVHAALASSNAAPEQVEAPRVPAVPIRSSVKADAIVCLECGKKTKLLKRHIGSDHGLTPAAYRARWDLASSYPMIAPDYAAARKEIALKIGLGRKRLGKADEQVADLDPKPRRRKRLGLAFAKAEPAEG